MQYDLELKPIIDLDVLLDGLKAYFLELREVFCKQQSVMLNFVNNDFDSIDFKSDAFNINFDKLNKRHKLIGDQINSVRHHLDESYNLLKEYFC